MAEITIEAAPQRARDLFNKGFIAFERGSLDYAIDLFTSALEVCPELLRARKFLRAAEIKRFNDSNPGMAVHAMSWIQGLPAYIRAWLHLRGGRGGNALTAAEALLRLDPLNIGFIELFGRAALAAGLPEAGVQTLEVACEHHPANVPLRKQLGRLYERAGATRQARMLFEKLAEEFPSDGDIMKSLKDVTALESIRGDWNTVADGSGTYRNVLRNTEEATTLEREARAVRAEGDTDTLIAEMRERVRADPDNMNHRRSLARLFAQRKRFDEAEEVLTEAIARASGDPELTAMLSRTRVQRFDHEIALLREAGDSERAAEMEKERESFVYDDLRERVERYPNDLSLRFLLGDAYYRRGMVMEAIQQFQFSQRHAQYRVRSLFQLARCFRAKKQYDMAVEQLEKAIAELTDMDDTLKEICYELGDLSEALGRKEKAIECYKRIYQADVGYRDVAKKIEQSYAEA